MKSLYLCFVDGLILFEHGDIKSISVMASMLSFFSYLSEMKVNVAKNQLFASGLHPQVNRRIMDLVSFLEGQLLIQYLGVPLLTRGFKVSNYKVLVDNIL